MMPVLQNSNIFVLDNGGGTLKAGDANMAAPRVIPNCITKAKSEKRRAFIGDQMDDCCDLSELYYISTVSLKKVTFFVYNYKIIKF